MSFSNIYTINLRIHTYFVYTHLNKYPEKSMHCCISKQTCYCSNFYEYDYVLKNGKIILTSTFHIAKITQGYHTIINFSFVHLL